jgi:hypothetical protein
LHSNYSHPSHHPLNLFIHLHTYPLNHVARRFQDLRPRQRARRSCHQPWPPWSLSIRPHHLYVLSPHTCFHPQSPPPNLLTTFPNTPSFISIPNK